MSTSLQPLESDDPHVAGVLIQFDSGLPGKVVHWRSKGGEIISPALEAAKEYTAAVLDSLMKENREADIRNTNWVSVAAAMHKLIRDFNGTLRDARRERDAATLQ